MTENEAIEEVKRWTSILLSAGAKCVSETAEAQDMAIKVLEEVQKYRAIGTPEECRAAVEKQKDIIRKAIDGFAKWLENKKYLMKEIQEHDFCYTHYNELKANCVTTEYLAEQVKAGDEE